MRSRRRCLNPAAAFLETEMTGEEPRQLVAGDRVFWQGDVENQGIVKGTSWSGVTIDWDDGDSSSISHNDMAQVHRTKP
jgi:hypothetical protein